MTTYKMARRNVVAAAEARGRAAGRRPGEEAYRFCDQALHAYGVQACGLPESVIEALFEYQAARGRFNGAQPAEEPSSAGIIATTVSWCSSVVGEFLSAADRVAAICLAYSQGDDASGEEI